MGKIPKEELKLDFTKSLSGTKSSSGSRKESRGSGNTYGGITDFEDSNSNGYGKAGAEGEYSWETWGDPL